MSTTNTATTDNSNEWGYVSDESSELRSERSSEHQKNKLDLSRLKAMFKGHLQDKFGNIKSVSFFLGIEEMTDENLHFLLMMLLLSFSQLVIHDYAKSTKLNKVYLDTKCGASATGRFLYQITSAINIFNTFLPREFTRGFYEITDVCLFQNNEGVTHIVIGIKGFKPFSSLPNGFKLVYHWKRHEILTYTVQLIDYMWLKSKYDFHDMVQIASSFKKEEKKTETPAMDKPKTSVMKSGVAPLDAWNRSETTDAISDTTQTTQTTDPLPNMASKSGSSDSEFDTVLITLKKSNFTEKEYKRLQSVLVAKMDLLEL